MNAEIRTFAALGARRLESVVGMLARSKPALYRDEMDRFEADESVGIL